MRGKQLVVVGGPFGDNPVRQGLHIAAHGAGDVCVDLSKGACPVDHYTPGDVTNLPFYNKQFGAVFCSHVLEHMSDIPMCHQAWRELHRVADTVFLCVPSKLELIAWFIPDHHLWVQQVGLYTLLVEDRDTHAKAMVQASPCPAS